MMGGVHAALNLLHHYTQKYHGVQCSQKNTSHPNMEIRRTRATMCVFDSVKHAHGCPGSSNFHIRIACVLLRALNTVIFLCILMQQVQCCMYPTHHEKNKKGSFL